MDAAPSACLDAHNSFRTKHGALPLVLEEKLNTQARLYAEAVLTGNCPAVTANLGVNVYHVCDIEEGDPLSTVAKEAVYGWYDHLGDYNWDCPTKSEKEAFTACQLLWKSTKSLGVGVAVDGEEVVVVALYSPAASNAVSNTAFDQIYKDNVGRSS